MWLPLTSIRLRSWIAALAIYSLALQAVFGGILIGRLGAAAIGSDGFSAICASHSSAADDGTRPGQPPSAHDPICVFCIAASGHAVLPHPTILAEVDFSADSSPELQARDMVLAFSSPTGQYQRGPPHSAAVAG
jgi:hypothetical protein